MELTAELRAAIARHGDNCNSFLTLYRGFKYFRAPEGIVPYSDTKHAWVGASEPLAPATDREALLRSFAAAAAAQGKVAVALPVSHATAQAAARAGWGFLKIGTEPKFELSRYEARPDRVANARQLASRGASVEEFRPEKLHPDERRELDQITEEWLSSRKTVALGFLNTVDPWALGDDKRYFRIAQNGQVLAFIAAIPIWSREGWYLIDVLRRDRVPTGTVELLMLESIRLLKRGGAREISLGVAPLSGLQSQAAADSNYRQIYRWLHFSYRNGNPFYNFKPLHQFKLKFAPTHSEDAYLIFQPPRLSFAVMRGLLQAFLPDGVVHAVMVGVYRGYFRFRFREWFTAQLSGVLVYRPPAQSLGILFWRLRWTIGIGVLIYAIHAARTPEWLDRFAFSAGSLSGPSLPQLALSPFLHWGLTHLWTNTFALVFFCGVVEYLAGSAAMVSCFLLGAFLSNPLTELWLDGIGQYVPWVWSYASRERDVGASLGIFACAGVFPHLFRRGYLIITLLIVGTAADSMISGSFLVLDHITALILGFVAFAAWLWI